MKNPSALKSAPFWILLVVSVGVAAYGVQAAIGRIAAMEAVLGDGTATTAQVYGGQSWVVLESILAGAGILGVLIALAVWALTPRLAVATAVASPVESTGTLPEPAPAEQDATDAATEAQPAPEHVAPAEQPALTR